MAIYSLTGNDTFTLDTYGPLTEMADGSIVSIEFGNAKTGHTTGKNGNTVFATDKQGENAAVTLRIMAGGKDDTYLNGRSIDQDRDLPTFPLLTGTFSKRVGDGTGKVKFINYNLLGGVFENNVDTQENLQGETEQGIAIYRLWFAQAQRALV